MNREPWPWRFLDWARTNPWLMVPTLAACLLVGGWGFYRYYGPQFEWIGVQNWFVYPFVPDCPLFVYLFALVFIAHYFGRSHPALTAFVAIGNIKYGAWTIFVLLYYFDHFFGGGGDAAFRSVILLLHVGMIPLGLLLWRILGPLRPRHVLSAGALLLVYDYFDYFFTRSYQVYPVGLPNHGVTNPYTVAELGIVPWFTVLETLLLTAWVYWTRVPRAQPPDRLEASPQTPA